MLFLFTDKGSSDALQDLEDSLALANRELNTGKESLPSFPASGTVPPSLPARTLSQQQLRSTVAPILDDTDDVTRQIAEEVMKQNIGPSSSGIGQSLCNGDAEESIKAIARSLSNTGMMLAAEAKQKPQEVATPTFQPTPVVFTNTSSTRPLGQSAHSTVEYFPPNVAIQNLPLTSSSSVGLLIGNVISNKTPIQISQVFAGQGQTNVIPQNVTVTPQGIITSHVPTSSVRPQTAVFTQPVTISDTSSGTGNQSAGVIPIPGPQQLTAQQLSALVQQAAAQLPPLPPYKPRQQRVSTNASSVTIQHLGPAQTATTTQKSQPVTMTTIRPSTLTTTATGVSVAQDLVVQQLNRQQEQILAQQILQQKLATISAPAPLRVTLPSSQNLGFSTILQQGQIGRLNQGVVQTLPSIGQITHLIKADFPTSQISAPVSIPTTNIVWTSPPNVTITTPNGVPRPVQQVKSATQKLLGIPTASLGAPIKETFIDLTETDPPPYEATQSVLAKTVPPPVYPTQTTTSSTAVPGKS